MATAGFAFAPNIFVAVALNCVITAALAIIGPGVLAALSLAIPPRARATGFAIGSLWVIPGLVDPPDDRLDRRQLEHRRSACSS